MQAPATTCITCQAGGATDGKDSKGGDKKATAPDLKCVLLAVILVPRAEPLIDPLGGTPGWTPQVSPIGPTLIINVLIDAFHVFSCGVSGKNQQQIGQVDAFALQPKFPKVLWPKGSHLEDSGGVGVGPRDDQML